VSGWPHGWPHGWLLPDWPAPATVRACVTTRTGGMSVPPFDSFNRRRSRWRRSVGGRLEFASICRVCLVVDRSG